MKRTIVRGAVGAALAGAALVGAAAPALAEPAPAPGGVAVVGEPDTGNLNNKYTFAPLGVPVLGLIESINAAPGRLLPSFG